MTIAAGLLFLPAETITPARAGETGRNWQKLAETGRNWFKPAETGINRKLYVDGFN